MVRLENRHARVQPVKWLRFPIISDPKPRLVSIPKPGPGLARLISSYFIARAKSTRVAFTCGSINFTIYIASTCGEFGSKVFIFSPRRNTFCFFARNSRRLRYGCERLLRFLVGRKSDSGLFTNYLQGCVIFVLEIEGNFLHRGKKFRDSIKPVWSKKSE